MIFAEILFQRKIGQENDLLTYSIPNNLDLQIGQAVKVPLRKSEISGIVWKIHSNKPDFRTVNIKEIITEKPLVSEKQIKLIEWISKYYFCPLHKILKLFIPKRVLENKDFREKKEKEIQFDKNTEKNLTKEQENGLNKIINEKKNKFLVHGITGSGKTEIYARLAKKYITKNKQVLILVPEISLTPQTINYFQNSLQIKATVINSKISEGERYKAWKEIHENKAKLVIGSRSAIFSPFQDLGAIIIDEEHENSYKQDNSPRYHTHQIAEKIIELNPETKLVLGSATPSIETTEKYKDSIIYLNERIGSAKLPDIEIVDLRDEFKKKNFSIFSDKLRTEIKDKLAKKEQIILFLNRRGSASSVVCRDCGQKAECKDCELAFTYHASTLSQSKLICHHCGKIENPPSLCPVCQGVNIRFLGIGTQRIEEEIKKEFPEAKVLRADKDTTSKKEGFKNIYEKFKKHEADILIGTQMIAKGLHLPKVSLVGVILADIGLNMPDFRASERNFQLMTQVSGRAGRSKSPGKVIIQSYNPEHLALNCTKNQSYDDFFNYERTQRKILNNPPFSKLAKITIENTSYKEAQRISEEIDRKLWQIARENNFADKLEINSYPAYIMRLRGKYRIIVLIKIKEENDLLHNLVENLGKEYIIDPNIKIDIDPIQIT